MNDAPLTLAVDLGGTRMRAAVVTDDLLETCEHWGDVLVFGHGHSLTALTIRWLGLPIGYGRHLRLGTASLSVLGWKREVRVLEVWNDRSHLVEAT
jgi:broad specificity phosphatase PhoE